MKLKTKLGKSGIFFFLIGFALLSYVVFAQQTLEDIAKRPKVVGNIDHEEFAKVREPFRFSARCSDDKMQLFICSSDASCNRFTQPQDLLCVSTSINESIKECWYAPTDEDKGVHKENVATCCTNEGICDQSLSKIKPWMVISGDINQLTTLDENNMPIAAVQETIGAVTKLSFVNHSVSELEFLDLKGSIIKVGSTVRGLIEPENVTFSRVYSFDTTNVNFTRASSSSRSENNLMYQCKFWDFELSICLNAWEFIQELHPGELYKRELQRGSIAFAEGFGEILKPQTLEDEITGVLRKSHISLNETLTFSTTCRQKNSIRNRLMICRSASCDSFTQPQEIICASDLSESETKECIFTPAENDVGVHAETFATCCNEENNCIDPIAIPPWSINRAVNISPTIAEPIVQAVQDEVEQEELIQEKAEINKPVKWTKKLRLKKIQENISVALHPEASNIRVHEIVGRDKQEIFPTKWKTKRLINSTEIFINESLKDTDIEYFTEPPQILEEEVSQYKKKVIITSQVHYENITTYASIQETTKDRIHLYWIINGTEMSITDASYLDVNNNGLIDRVQWIVPSLSNQTYIIEITKAEHLDQNKIFIKEIYEEVKTLDSLWSGPIYHNEFVRVVFEQQLSSENDITIYPRNTLGGRTKVEVYITNTSQKIAEFPIIASETYYKIFLTAMQGAYDTFDLKVVNENNNQNDFLEFNHIIDPKATAVPQSGEIVLRPRACRAQISGSSQYIFGSVCDGSYPNSCTAGGDLISCTADNRFENQFAGRTAGGAPLYGGINASFFNASITDCASIIDVQLCHRVTIDAADTGYTCNFAVDNDADNSFVAVTAPAGCPSSTFPSTVTCINATANETWSCNDFFGSSSGPRARAVAQAYDEAGAGNEDIFAIDVLLFNVTYNVAPKVEEISSSGYTIAAQSVTENGITELRANFLVTDPDGTGDLDDTTANLTLIKSSGSGTIGNMSTNTTCYANADVDSDTANYTCTVQIQYWFLAGAWNLTAGIRDLKGAQSTNTTNFTLQETTAIVISPLSIAFSQITLGQENVTSSNDPLVINNTANDDIASGNVRMTGVDLIGEVTSSRTISANNFTVDIDTGGSPAAECTAGTQLVNATATGIASSVLAAGNRSASLGIEELYICFNKVPTGLTPQAYSTVNGTAWTVSVV